MDAYPLITIITPVYKAEQFLDRCVSSIIAQKYTNWELLLIDDGSPDCSGKICDEWSQKDSRIRVFHKKNGGVSSARNKGLEQAKGEWIMFVDSDDWISDDCLEVCVGVLLDEQVDVLQYNFVKVTARGNIRPESDVSCDVCTLEEYINSEKGLLGVCVAGGIFNRGIIEAYKIRFDERMRYAEDGVFVCANLFYANRIIHIANPMYFYFMNEDSAMHNINVDAYLDSLLLQIDFLDKHPIFQRAYSNLVTMNVGTVCTFGITKNQRKRIQDIWLKYRDNSPYVHIDDYHNSRSIEYVFLPIQKYSFTLAWFFTALFTKVFWLLKND